MKILVTLKISILRNNYSSYSFQDTTVYVYTLTNDLSVNKGVY